jgi:apolipoprotein N-acyltransferase
MRWKSHGSASAVLAEPGTIGAVMNSARSRYLSSIAAGALLPFAFAPVSFYWLAPFCFAVLFLAWQGAAPRQAAAAGFLFGAASFLGGVHWIYVSVHIVDRQPVALAVVLTAILVAGMALYPAAVAWIAARFFRTAGLRAYLLVLPALWVLAEWLRGWLLTGFGWLSAGYSQTDSWLAAYAPIVGVLGVSYAVMLAAGSIATLVAGGRQSRIAASIVLTLTIGAAFLLREHAWTERSGRELSVALVQGAVPQDRKWLAEQLPITMEQYRVLTQEAHGADLIVWPEAAIPQLFENMGRYLSQIEREAGAHGSTLMLGMLSYDRPTARARNSVFALGHPESVYSKRHLVPYGEYYPLPQFLRSVARSFGLEDPNTLPGEPGQRPMHLLGERIAVTICYEDVFGAEQLHSFPEATLLVNVSNDAWFGESIAADQHLQIARMRAAEVGRYLLRSTNTGITAIVDPFGRVADGLPQFEDGVLKASVDGMEGSTPYIIWGNYAILLVCSLALGAYPVITKFTIRPGT